MSDDMIPASEAARILGIKPDTLNKWVRRGKLTPVRKIHGRLWLYDRVEVEALKSLRRLAGREKE